MRHRYQQFQPIEAFRHLVDAYWINRPDDIDGAPFDRVLPDGSIDLIFRGGPAGGRLFTSALIEQPSFISGDAQGWFIGVRFRPAMARAILDLDPGDCRGRNIPAAAIDARFAALEDNLRHCASPEQALVLLRRAIDERLGRGERRAPPRRVQEAVRLLARGGDDAQIREVARALGIAERSLHRELVRWAGLKPKSLARILRMQRTMRAIRAGSAPLAELALHMGYADQAHMTRELKSLTGFTPAEIAPRRTRRNPRPVRNLQDAAGAPPYLG